MVRIKHRYLLVNILYPDPQTSNVRLTAKSGEEVFYTMQFRQPSSEKMDGKILFRMIKDGVAELFGDYGAGKIAGSLQVKYFSQATSTAIVRVSRDHYRLVWSALAFATQLPQPLSQPCVIQVVRVSGTIRKAEEEAIRRARISIRRAQRASKPARTIVGTDGFSKTTDGFRRVQEGEDLNDSMLGGIEDTDGPSVAGEESDGILLS
ncbi:hypothetical protein LTR62_000975 [Meristemomyces frigidus]|uniref:Ribonuclease P/MRP protein subunit POP5 n=1 Tax=Meristemomyces frigidus TaxID=1508187 RepID=A0AAN7T8H1_9PEZI|nr:hypothetical protein LTR62_000975 [Meristemomyces frigidus]